MGQGDISTSQNTVLSNGLSGRSVHAGMGQESRCPICNAPFHLRSPIVDLNRNIIVIGKDVILLSPQHSVIAHILVKYMPKIATHHKLIVGIWGYEEPNDVHACVRAAMTAIRRKLKPYGYSIKSVHSKGYYLDKINGGDA